MSLAVVRVHEGATQKQKIKKGDKITFKASDLGATSNETFELSVSKGNKKPIPSNVWLISMQSATRCYCRREGLCPIASDCYGLDYETNPLFKDATLNCRNKDETAIDFLVHTEGGATFLANELLKRSRRARSDRTRLGFLRWNVTGDLKSRAYLDFVETVAKRLYLARATVSVIYTHNKAVALDFQKDRLAKNDTLSFASLRVLGSGFMIDANFDCFTEDPQALECQSDCVECFERYGWGLCYDPNKRGAVIKEAFRPSKSNERGL